MISSIKLNKTAFLLLTAICLLPIFSFAQINRANTKKSVPYKANYQRIAAGASHTLEIRNGTLWAWGRNDYGQLGDGTTVYKIIPTQMGADSSWVSISAGVHHTVGLKSDGTLWAWGGNYWGELGDGTTAPKNIPTQIGADNKWISIAASGLHSVGLKSDGTLWAWGQNDYGQLGDGTTAPKNIPTQIGADNKWISIAASGAQTFGLKSDGTLWAWGWNNYGQLGDGTTANKDIPAKIGVDSNWVSIAAGSRHTLALKSNGTLWAWGENGYGQLGDGSTANDSIPMQIGTDKSWVRISAGDRHTLALKSDGTLWAWGWNLNGQLGDGTTANDSVPKQIGTDNNWVSIAAGRYYNTFGLKSDGTLWAWGDNYNGILGDGTYVNKSIPTQIGLPLNVWLRVVAGGNHSVGLKSDGTLWTWGYNEQGDLGDGTTIDKSSPVEIGPDNNWVSIEAGWNYTLGLRSDGTLWAWGWNNYGQLGDGTTANDSIPKQIGTDKSWVSIIAGRQHTLGLKSDGTIWAWGRNTYGQLGDGTTVDKSIPTKISADSNWVSISAGGYHTVGLKSNGTLWAWGGNQYGQLGDGTTVDKNIPIQIGTDNKWVTISAGWEFTTGLKSDGTLWAWGSNYNGQLGDGTTVAKNLPTQTGADIKWVNAAAGMQHTVALKSDGTIWNWGENWYGQLGDGTTAQKNSPTQIGSYNNWVSIAAGEGHTFGLKSDRNQFCATGNNGYGQLGNCNLTNSSVFVCSTNNIVALAVSSLAVSCNGGSNGSATATISGGITPISYIWSNGSSESNGGLESLIATLPAQIYYVTATDNCNRTKTDSVTITEPSLLTAAITKTEVSCYGGGNGTATATPSGGTFPYNYNWSNGQAIQTIGNLFPGTYSVNVFDLNGCGSNSVINISQPAPLAVSVSSTNNNCNGGNTGTASASPSGGSSPYTFLWSSGATTPQISNLTSQIYFVTVTDSCNISKTDSVIITQPAALSSSITKTDVNCFGNNNGSATTNPTGGTSPFSYNWSTGATISSVSGLPPSVYYVTITDACTATKTDSVTIAEPALLVATNISKTNVSCYGGGNGTATANPAGGNSPFTYNWSNGQTGQTAIGLFAGTYGVNVFDAMGCLASNSVTIFQPTALTATVTATAVSCNSGSDGAANLILSGGTSPYTFNWSNNATTEDITALATGTYSVTINDSCGASITQTVNITEPGALSTTITKTNVSCNDGTNGSASVSVSGGVTPYSYLWNTGATTNSIFNIQSSTFIITITDACGQSKVDSAIISEPTTLTTSISKINVGCYGAGDGTATISATGGSSPYTYFWSNNQTTATAVGLFPGFFSVNVVDANGCLATGNTNITQPSQLSAIISASYVSCNSGSDGAANLTLSGGTSPYTFNWSNSATTEDISGLATGTYSVTINDSCGASVIQTVNITEPGTLSTAITKTNVSCNGGTNGSASVSVSGGVTPYIYLWSNGETSSSVSGLPSSVYYVTATDNCGQSKVDSAIITEPELLTSSMTKTDITCFGFGNGTATITASGGTTPYNYVWGGNAGNQTTSTAVNLFAGNYFVNVFDAGSCPASGNIVITQPSALSLNISSTTATCGGADATATVTPTGGTPLYTYNWSNGDTTSSVSGLPSSVYYVTITDANSCTASENINIGVAALPQEICLVTVDSNGTKNLVVWEKPIASNIDSFRIYRDIVGTYTKIGAVAYNDLSKFVDVTNGVNPNITSYRYKITAVDTCGNESAFSNYHKTMHLTKNVGTQGEINLIWDGYEGFSSNFYYRILKDSIGNGNFIAIDSVSNNNFTYTVPPPTINTQYLIEVIEPSGGCLVTKSVENHNSSRSNKTFAAPPGSTLSASTETTPASAGNCDGTATVTATGGLTPYSYQWDGNAGNQTTEIATGLCPGTFSVVVSDAAGGNTMVFATVDVMPGINSPEEGGYDVSVYPNPNNGMFTISIKNEKLNFENVKVVVNNVLGEVAYNSSFIIRNSTINIDLKGLAQGIYNLQLISEEGIITRRIIVE